MPRRIRLAATAAAATAAVLTPMIASSAAQAAVTGYAATVQYIGGGSYVNVRTQADIASSVAYTVSPGTGLSIDCQTVGSRLGFSAYADNRTWDRLSDGHYVSDVVTTTPGGSRQYLSDGGYTAYSSGIPQCSAPAAAPAPAPAPAASTNYTATSQYVGGGSTLNVRQQADINSGVVYTVPNGSGISIVCQTIGSRLGFSRYADNRTWDQLADGHWIHDVVTSTPGGARSYPSDGGYTAFTSGLPRCSSGGSSTPVADTSNRASTAASWAHDQIGQTNTSATPTGRWSGYCETFVERAYGVSTVPPGYTSASADYRAQLAAGRIHTDRNPPAGALVFYSVPEDSDGHVSISLGGGQTVSTFGYDSDAKPVEPVAVGNRGLDYLGWSYAPDSWTGR